MSEYQIGSELQHKDQTWRIVRIVTHDVSLFEDEKGSYLVVESYLQLKSPTGQVDFIVLDSDKAQYQGPASSIKALNPLTWRQHS